MKTVSVLSVISLNLLLRGASSSPIGDEPKMNTGVFELELPHGKDLGKTDAQHWDMMQLASTTKHDMFRNATSYHPDFTDPDDYDDNDDDDDDDDDDDYDDIDDDDDDGTGYLRGDDDGDDDDGDEKEDTSLTNVTTSHLTKRKGRHRKVPWEPTMIPWTKYKCETTEPAVKLDDVYAARNRLADWGSKNNIMWGRWHGEVVGTAFWYTCYCKPQRLRLAQFRKHAVPWEQLHAAQNFLLDRCGPGKGGQANVTMQPAWLWSYDWRRIWTIMPRKHSHHIQHTLCSRKCLRRSSLTTHTVMEP